MKKICKIILLVLVLSVNAEAQQITWQKWYDYNNYDNDGEDVVQTFDGGYIILVNNYVISNYGTVLIKINNLGDVEWKKLIDQNITGGDGISCFAVHQSKDSGYIISGYMIDSAVLFKTNVLGNLQWIRKYSKPGMQARFFDHNLTSDGGIISCGDLYKPYKGYVVKTDSIGNVEWDSIYNLRVTKIIESMDGNFYLLGGIATLTKINNIGKIIWGNSSFCCATVDLIENPSGFIFTGGGEDSLILNKFDTAGTNILQRGYYNGVLGFESMCLSRDGNILLAGIKDTLLQFDMAVAKVDYYGNLLFTKKISSRIGGNFSFLPRSVKSTKDSGFIFAGFTDFPGFPYGDNCFGAKTDSLCNAPLIVNIANTNRFSPSEFTLYQNYPNPFNPITTINYELSKASFVNVKIYDIQGEEICNLVNRYQTIGQYKVQFNSLRYNLTSGIYFCKLSVDDKSEVKKLILIK